MVSQTRGFLALAEELKVCESTIKYEIYFYWKNQCQSRNVFHCKIYF